MRPPECAVCGRRLRDFPVGSTHNFDVVRFADYAAPAEEHEGSPYPGSDWFCKYHLNGARELAARAMPLPEALQELALTGRRGHRDHHAGFVGRILGRQQH